MGVVQLVLEHPVAIGEVVGSSPSVHTLFISYFHKHYAVVSEFVYKVGLQLIAGIMTAMVFTIGFGLAGVEYHLPSVIVGIFIYASVSAAGKFYGHRS